MAGLSYTAKIELDDADAREYLTSERLPPHTAAAKYIADRWPPEAEPPILLASLRERKRHLARVQAKRKDNRHGSS